MKWLQLQPREQQLVGLMGAFIAILVLFTMVTSIISFNRNLSQYVNNLFKFSVYSKTSCQYA